uniref:Ubiquitin-like domain-containing protein n=1 Tax=Prolemur simus TaxID=1328070 RepID=A0A8C9AJU5_PROSS
WQLFLENALANYVIIMATQIKAHLASLKGIAWEDEAVLLAGMTLEDEATLGQCRVEALTTLEVAGCMLGGKVQGALSPCWESERSDS